MRIGLDLDGVLHDFCTDMRRLLDKPELPVPDRWEMWECWGMSEGEWWRLFFEVGCCCDLDGHAHPILFADPDLAYPGAVDFAKELKARGHELHVISHRPKIMHNRTHDWLVEVGVPFDSLTLTPNKTDVHVDVMIEDNVDNARAAIAVGAHTILIDRPWNRRWRGEDVKAEPGLSICNTWESALRVVENVAAADAQ